MVPIAKRWLKIIRRVARGSWENTPSPFLVQNGLFRIIPNSFTAPRRYWFDTNQNYIPLLKNMTTRLRMMQCSLQTILHTSVLHRRRKKRISNLITWLATQMKDMKYFARCDDYIQLFVRRNDFLHWFFPSKLILSKWQ